jgi:16S rRNA (guanine1207-N2)-methyltransferase
VIGAGMTKHVHNSTTKSFERWIGPTTTSRARSRARLLFAEVQAPVRQPLAPQPIEGPGEGFTLWLEPGVFAKQGIDPGSAQLLHWIPRLPDEGRDQLIADAGCGSGLLTATAALRNPRAEVIGTDESHLAVASAQRTLGTFENARAEVAKVLSTLGDGSTDLVVSNPPQHQAAALSQQLLSMFIDEARRVLRPTGNVRMVANRHVNLNVALASAFDRVRILDQDRRFMVCEAEGPISAAPRTG